MSNATDKFQDSRRTLAFSTGLLEQLRPQPQMAEMAPEAPMDEGMPEEQPVEAEMAQEAPVEPQEQEKGFVDLIQEAVAPMFDKLTSLITKKEEEPKDAKITLDATVEPKKEDDETSKES